MWRAKKVKFMAAKRAADLSARSRCSHSTIQRKQAPKRSANHKSNGVDLMSGTSSTSRKRYGVTDAPSSEGVPTKRRRRTFTSNSIAGDYQHLPVPCTEEFSDQCVPTQNDSLLSVHGDRHQLDFYDDATFSNLKEEVDVASCSHPLGYFNSLPTELFHSVLSMLENPDLASLANVSAEMCSSVCGYVYSPLGLRLVLPLYCEGEFAEPYVFTELGHLLKQLTMQLPSRSRLRTASFFLNKLESTHELICDCEGAAVAYECFGELFSAFIKGWEDRDKCRAFSLVQTNSRLEGRVQRVLSSATSSLPTQERDVRLFHRYMFLLPAKRCSDQEYAFWLTQILKPWPITYQAKLLYLLTAPEDENGFVSWTEVCGCSHIQHTRGGYVDFTDIARALRVLHHYRPADWGDDDVISIVEELTSTPNGWCLENVAQLLHKCGQEITMKVLGSWAVNERMDRLSVLCYYLANSCATSDDIESDRLTNMRWFIAVLHHVYSLLPSSHAKSQFLSSLTDKWRDYIMALFEDSVTDNDRDIDTQLEFYSTLTSLTKVTSALLSMSMKKL